MMMRTIAAAAAPATAIVVPARVERALARPVVLPALYASYAALQAYDLYSTRQALGRGAQESNPLMQGVVGNTGAFVALKAGVAAGTILAAGCVSVRMASPTRLKASGLMQPCVASPTGSCAAASSWAVITIIGSACPSGVPRTSRVQVRRYRGGVTLP